MYDWLTHRAAATPETLALIDTDTDTRWSYSGLDAAVDETAGRLAALGIEPGDHVGMLMGTQLLSICLLHAAQRLGVRLVPLNDRLTADTLAGQIDHSDLSVVVCGADTEQLAVEATGSTPVASVDDPQWAEVKSFRGVEPDPVEPVEWARDDPQLMVYTSGSTGEPKAVVLTMGNLLSSATASAFRLGVDPDDRWLLTLAFYHVGGLAPVFRSTLYGTAVVLRSGFDPGGVADDIDRYDVSVVSLVPTMLAEMLERRGTLSESLRAVLLGGAPAPDSLIERCRNYSVPVLPTYGMTETASQIATARPAEAFDRPDTVGRPLLWTRLTIVDDEGRPVEAGERGEIVVSGPTVAAGYYGDVDANVEAFGEYGLHTGDVGYQTEDGSLFVLNRLDDRIITGGENVDPGEVVEVLREHPEVDAAAVVGVDDDTWGQRVAALVVPKTETVSASTLEAACRERLAGYKCPKQIAFTDALPRTASGTIKRPAVREQLAALADEPADALLSEGGETDPDPADSRAVDDPASDNSAIEPEEPSAIEPGDDGSVDESRDELPSGEESVDDAHDEPASRGE